ncbi:glycosyltransferase family 2 protein [Flavobacterium psychrophilum]|uniref:glycosyltransferase family 2 protein n=1 Tax=Flavobacterium psychrophilum TaxID=96345 RepID=UPI000B7C29EC|nr:glycosyltransferase [Flavobacterium psychrophilum]SNA70475.1 putative rhamnosyl transferase [Flavobacterium psychrophilum]
MKIAFVCVNYNNSKITQEYILNVLALKQHHDLKIIVVDNASESNDVKQLSAYVDQINKDQVVLIKSDSNLGYFKGLNLGIKWALEKGYNEYQVVGNNDLVFSPDFLEVLKLKDLNTEVFVIAPNIIRLDGVHQNPHIVAKFTSLQKMYRKLYFTHYYIGIFVQFVYNMIRSKLVKEDRINNDVEQQILMGYGACYILTKSFFNVFNELDAPVFLMGEEGILANQVLSRNGVTLYCPDLIVNHHDHSSIGKVPSKKLYKFSQDSYKYYLKHLRHVQ